ncbi:hypothetical protein NHH03_14345 [Stieleria sp. TO1_6]|uniref:hypothetical protein n=1 Tax=Stieleria tagensis TaxID=2956795 RepID=UPI00209B2742|nr:hypothetical protein [Stieleria tagensis]MCO8122925.1 hypothetical protein [Stieleria tagensis]
MLRCGMAAALALATTIAVACNIPVFRYALERWQPDSSQVIIFHEGPLTSAQQQLLESIRAGSKQDGGHANAEVVQVDLNADDDPKRREWWSEMKTLPGVQLPAVLLRTRLGQGRFVNHWHGTLQAAVDVGLYQSPARDEIRDRLLAGHSVVWLLIGSSDSDRNDQAKDQLETTFTTLANKIKLPQGIGLPGSELYADVPLVVKFSVLQIDGDDPREAVLTGLLTGLRKQAFEDGEPLLVPVFGRGRALEVIPATDLSARMVEDLTLFLSGACSCQVKQQNPGFDLLIDADWDGQLFGDESNRPPDRSADVGKNRSPVLLTIPPGRN